MKKYYLLALGMAICIIVIFILIVKPGRPSEYIPDSQVKQAIQVFAKLVDPQIINEFGLSSVAEILTLKPGKQFKEFVIGLDDLKKYKAGDDLNKLIIEYPSIEVSLVDSVGAIRSSIEFVKNRKKWEVSGYGSTAGFNYVRYAQPYIPDSIIRKGTLIRIPALQTSFIADSSHGNLYFYFLKDYSGWGFHKGDRMLASDALLKFVPAAIDRDDTPD